MTYTRGQITTSAAWFLIVGGILIAQFMSKESPAPMWLDLGKQLLKVSLVALLWITLIAQIMRGPMQPPLLIRPQRDTSGWLGSTYYVKLPSDYVRLGEPVPASAITWWQVGQIILGILAVTFTVLLLTGRFVV